jgi:acyl carrier protein
MTIEHQDLSPEIMTIIARLAETSAEAVACCGAVSDLAGWDSLKHIILLASIERTFQIKVPIDAFLAADRLADIFGLVAAKEPQS